MPLAAATAVAGELGPYCFYRKTVSCAEGDFNVQELFCFTLFQTKAVCALNAR